jgi:hypothetical protein
MVEGDQGLRRQGGIAIALHLLSPSSRSCATARKLSRRRRPLPASDQASLSTSTAIQAALLPQLAVPLRHDRGAAYSQSRACPRTMDGARQIAQYVSRGGLSEGCRCTQTARTGVTRWSGTPHRKPPQRRHGPRQSRWRKRQRSTSPRRKWHAQRRASATVDEHHRMRVNPIVGHRDARDRPRRRRYV